MKKVREEIDSIPNIDSVENSKDDEGEEKEEAALVAEVDEKETFINTLIEAGFKRYVDSFNKAFDSAKEEEKDELAKEAADAKQKQKEMEASKPETIMKQKMADALRRKIPVCLDYPAKEMEFAADDLGEKNSL